MAKENNNFFKTAVILLVSLDLIVWFFIFSPVFSGGSEKLKLYFLDIGQGDSSLIVLPHSVSLGQASGVKILIDGGPPTGALQKNLEKIFSADDRYVDLVVVSHPQLDHFGGLIELLKNYKAGAVLTSDKISEQPAWQELEKVIKEKKIRRIILSAGDKIKYQNSEFDILSPKDSDVAKDINDFGLVAILNSDGIKAFYGADISGEKEKELADLYDMNVDILKVSHHGSKFSSNSDFLREASPEISVIEVGANNTYGHPTKEAFDRLAEFSKYIYRTDKNGLIEAVVDNGKLNVYSEKRF